MLEHMDWFACAGSLNQLSLIPFLGLLWTLWHIPSAPQRTVHGFTFYLVFIGVTIPAGMYCRQHLGTSLANVDWLHGPCEALLTTANLLIVLGLRDALKKVPPGGTPASSTSTTASSDGTECPPSSETDAGGMPSTHSARQQAGAACAPQTSWKHRLDGRQRDTGLVPFQPTTRSLGAEGPKPAAHHQLLNPDTHRHVRGPSILRSRHVVHSNSSTNSSSGLMCVPRVHVVSRAVPCMPAVHRGCHVCSLT